MGYNYLIQDIATVINPLTATIHLISNTIVEYEDSIANDKRDLVPLLNNVTVLTNEIGNLESQKRSAESTISTLETEIRGIDVDIAHENETISTANYYISNPNVHPNVREYWRNRRSTAQTQIANLQEQRLTASTILGIEQENVRSLAGQISSKKLERAIIQEDISRISQNIAMKRERIQFQRILLTQKQTEYLDAILRLQEIEREIAQVEVDLAYYQSLLSAELAKSPSAQNASWIQMLEEWIADCNRRLGN